MSESPRRPIVERLNPGAPGRPEYQVNDPNAFMHRISVLSRVKQLRFAGLHDEADRLLRSLSDAEAPSTPESGNVRAESAEQARIQEILRRGRYLLG